MMVGNEGVPTADVATKAQVAPAEPGAASGDYPGKPPDASTTPGATVGEQGGAAVSQRLVKWWLRPDLPSGRAWAAGPGYFGGDHFPAYQEQVAYPEAVTGQVGWRAREGGRRVTRAEANWEQIIGGPVDRPNSYSQFSQLDWFSGGAEAGGTMFANAFKRLTGAGRQNTAWLFLVVSMIPETHATSDGNAAVWHEIAHGRYDDEYEVMGYRLGRNMGENGWSREWLILRPNHEMNQSNVYQVFPDTRSLYRAAMERAFQKLREGYGQRLRIVHSPARTRVIGPFDDWIPQSPLGGVDCLTLSLHPGGQVQTREDYVRFLDKFDEDSYGTRNDCLAACRKLGVPYCNPEWSPNHGSASNSPCPIADVVIEESWNFFNEQADAQNLVGEAVFGEETLDPDAYRGSDEAGREAWRRSVDVYRARWRGSPVGPPFEG